MASIDLIYSKKQLRGAIHRAFPAHVRYYDCFFPKSGSHIINGFYCEMTSDRVCIRRFVYPLFDNSAGVSLSYSSELAAIPVSVCARYKSEQSFRDEVIGTIEFFRDQLLPMPPMPPMALPDFVEYTEALPGFPRIPHCNLGVICARVLMGEAEGLILGLRKIRPNLHPSDIEFCDCIINFIETDPSKAVRILLSMEIDKRKSLKLGGLKSEVQHPGVQ